MKLTYAQTLKIWWSFLWRNMVLVMPLFLAFVAVAAFFAVASVKGAPPGTEPQLPFWFPLVTWLVMMPLSLALQILALHWALQVKWSDFRLVVAPPEKNETPPVQG